MHTIATNWGKGNLLTQYHDTWLDLRNDLSTDSISLKHHTKKAHPTAIAFHVGAIAFRSKSLKLPSWISGTVALACCRNHFSWAGIAGWWDDGMMISWGYNQWIATSINDVWSPFLAYSQNWMMGKWPHIWWETARPWFLGSIFPWTNPIHGGWTWNWDL